MELIKDGKFSNPEEWRATVACEKFDKFDTEGCGAEYSVEPSDLVLRYFYGTHFQNYYTAIRCQQCDKYTRVNDVPPPVLKLVYTPENEAAATFDGFDDRI